MSDHEKEEIVASLQDTLKQLQYLLYKCDQQILVVDNLIDMTQSLITRIESPEYHIPKEWVLTMLKGNILYTLNALRRSMTSEVRKPTLHDS